MKEQTEYEINKQIKKQQLVRNEFMRSGEFAGKYEFPIIRRQQIDLDKIKLLSFRDTKKNDVENRDKTVHFFTYDWLFESVYSKAEQELEKLRQYYCLLSPDFSIFTNMPLSLQIESVFKSRWCGAYWQKQGLKVIPTVSWGDEKSFRFCFDGIEQGSVVAICTYYRENCEDDFMPGYKRMMEIIKPSAVLCYDEPFPSMTGNVIPLLPTTYEWTKSLNWKDQLQFQWEKHHRNISGLNPNDFKFIKYDDPYVKDEIVPCSICGHLALQDQYGNGECTHCGWKFSKDEDNFERKMKISYPMLVPPSRAREQYKKGIPFKATFEDFIYGLMFYSEMLLEHKGITYEVFLNNDYSIVFCSEDIYQKYRDTFEFYNNANIYGRKLKDIWDEIENPGFMYCG